MCVPVEGTGLVLRALYVAHQGFNGGPVLLQPPWDPCDPSIHHVCGERGRSAALGGGDAEATSSSILQGGAVRVWVMWSSFTTHHQGHALTAASILI